MIWLHELKPDRHTKSVVRALCSTVYDVHVDVETRDGSGVLVCSAQCHTEEISAYLRHLSCIDSQIMVVHLAPSENPWDELRAGAVDVMQWDGRPDAVLSKLARIDEVEAFIHSPAVADCVVGGSASLKRALRELVTAARFGTGPILILGESGTGKELAAGIAHRADTGFGQGPLIVVDCTTIVPGLAGSELFGHERGAFTGAVSSRSGACSAANGGYLFLDEIGELPLDLQPEFLRVVQEGSYKHVGGDRWQHSSFRLICATNRDLASEVREGRFRSDLYFRIAASIVELPPLRDRGDDISSLFEHFYHLAIGTSEPIALDTAVEAALSGRDYPGNLRDLRQLATRVAARHVGPGPITPGDLPTGDRPQISAGQSVATDPAHDLVTAVRNAVADGATLRDLRDRVTEMAIEAAVASASGNVKAAATRLGVTDRALHLRKSRSKASSAMATSE